MRNPFATTLATAAIGALLAITGAAPASAQGALSSAAALHGSGDALIDTVQYRRYRGGYYGRPYYGRPYYRRHDGGAAAAGLIGGLAAGALIGGAIASQQAQAAPLPRTADPDYIAYCSRKYRSFDPVTGTFLARDGLRYVCE